MFSGFGFLKPQAPQKLTRSTEYITIHNMYWRMIYIYIYLFIYLHLLYIYIYIYVYIYIHIHTHTHTNSTKMFKVRSAGTEPAGDLADRSRAAGHGLNSGPKKGQKIPESGFRVLGFGFWV